MKRQLRKILGAGQVNIRKGFIIPQTDIEAWLMAFDKLGFQQQGLAFSMGERDFYVAILATIVCCLGDAVCLLK